MLETLIRPPVVFLPKNSACGPFSTSTRWMSNCGRAISRPRLIGRPSITNETDWSNPADSAVEPTPRRKMLADEPEAALPAISEGTIVAISVTRVA